jgi:hypothetical protein
MKGSDSMNLRNVLIGTVLLIFMAISETLKNRNSTGSGAYRV